LCLKNEATRHWGWPIRGEWHEWARIVMKATIGNILKSKGAMAPALQPSNTESNRVSRANRRGRAHRNSDRMRTEELIRMIEEAEYSMPILDQRR